ncbi:MAG: hypothetical protein DRG78_00580 [Epsilonproteobacteria bacterium]|nr:MAG: hypothetical protein DRG78_00580 [Campylobacterota bacterium]
MSTGSRLFGLLNTHEKNKFRSDTGVKLVHDNTTTFVDVHLLIELKLDKYLMYTDNDSEEVTNFILNLSDVPIDYQKELILLIL